eukprot:s2590_g5.t1
MQEEDFLDEAAPRRRGKGGPQDFTFSAFVHPAPAAGAIPELREPLAMQPNQTGDRRLWHLTVQINASTIVMPAAQQAPAMMSLVLGAGLGGRGPAAAPTFEFSYTVQSAAGAVVRQAEGLSGEQGELKNIYYHKAAELGLSCGAENLRILSAGVTSWMKLDKQ